MGPWMLESWLGMFIDGLKKMPFFFFLYSQNRFSITQYLVVKKEKEFSFYLSTEFWVELFRLFNRNSNQVRTLLGAAAVNGLQTTFHASNMCQIQNDNSILTHPGEMARNTMEVSYVDLNQCLNRCIYRSGAWI